MSEVYVEVIDCDDDTVSVIVAHETAEQHGASGLAALAVQAGLPLAEVVALAERRQLHLAIERANTPEGQERRRAHARRVEQRDRALAPIGDTIERRPTGRRGREALIQTMKMWQPAT